MLLPKNTAAPLVFISTMALCLSAFAGTMWELSGSGKGYQFTVSGNQMRSEGASVTLRRAAGNESEFGTAMVVIKAKKYRNLDVTLAANLSTKNAKGGAVLWLRADNETEPIAFANTQDNVVEGRQQYVHREVSISVPYEAKRLAFGIVLVGNGEVAATHVRLSAKYSSTDPARNVSGRAVLEQAIKIIQTSALNSSNIDWEVAKPVLLAKITATSKAEDAYPAVRSLLAKLADHHSLFSEPRRSQALRTTGFAKFSPVISLHGNIGYLLMPGYIGEKTSSAKPFVENINTAIGNIAPQASCGWILDLRRDTGGNMWPMLSALRSFLGDANPGSFEDRSGSRTPWINSDYKELLPTSVASLETTPVAVLTGPNTASAGEVIAIAFRGRPLSRSFGQATAGLPTANETFSLSDGSQIALTVAHELDRLGRVYDGPIKPDEVVQSLEGTENDKDDVVRSATDWLHSVGCDQRKGHLAR